MNVHLNLPLYFNKHSQVNFLGHLIWIVICLSDESIACLRNDAIILTNYLRERLRPVEQEEVAQKAQLMQDRVAEKCKFVFQFYHLWFFDCQWKYTECVPLQCALVILSLQINNLLWLSFIKIQFFNEVSAIHFLGSDFSIRPKNNLPRIRKISQLISYEINLMIIIVIIIIITEQINFLKISKIQKYISVYLLLSAIAISQVGKTSRNSFEYSLMPNTLAVVMLVHTSS